MSGRGKLVTRATGPVNSNVNAERGQRTSAAYLYIGREIENPRINRQRDKYSGGRQGEDSDAAPKACPGVAIGEGVVAHHRVGCVNPIAAAGGPF